MDTLEGIDKAMQALEPHWAQLWKEVDAERKRFDVLMAQDHDLIGRLLKCHLVVEHYMERYLCKRLGDESLTRARLSFFQKAHLLPDHEAPALAKPGILQLNAIRNKFAHSLDAPLVDTDLGPIADFVAIARKGVAYPTPIEQIEAFCSIAFAMMLVFPDHLHNAVVEAMRHVRKVDSNSSSSGRAKARRST